MKHFPFLFVAFFFAAFLSNPLFPAPADAQDEDLYTGGEERQVEVAPEEADKPRVNNLPQNFKGMTGLMFTTATRTQKPGTVELGVGYLAEMSQTPDFTRTTYAFNGTVGIPGHLEFGLHVPYVESNLTYGFTEDVFGQVVRQFSRGSQKGMGSTEGMLKIAVDQPSLFLPSLALGVGFIAPGDKHSQEISQVKQWGARALAAVGIEINDLFFTDYTFAVMADAAVVLQDLGVSGRDYEEKHGEFHVGLIFPVLPRNYGVLIGEYEGLLMRGTTNQDDENSFFGGARLTTNHIALTFGAQQVLVEVRDMEDRIRYVANFSYKLGPPYPLFP